MDMYKINIDDRNYCSWSVYNATTLEQISMPGLNPEKEKLFSNDVFTFSENTNTIQIIHSSTRINENIPAVLVLDSNKTYGRKKNSNQVTNKCCKTKLLYKCIPDDTRIPSFLVPYEIKEIGFSKVLSNLYVTIRFESWNDTHPIGVISQTIGPVNILDNFYEYQLYCKSLNASIQKFNKDTNKLLKEKALSHDVFIENIFKKHKEIEDRTSNSNWNIFTIDPATSVDYDDGFSVKKLNDNQTLLSIYIANVTIWMDSLNLWSSFSRRISTIYLPDRKRPMLPTILSDCLCSLQQGVNRFAFTMDIIIDNEFNITSISYKNCMIRVFKNYSYESKELLQNHDYHTLLELCKGLTYKYKYLNSVRNSH